MRNVVERAYAATYSDSVMRRVERVAVVAAAIAFLLHLAIVALAKGNASFVDLDWFSSSYFSALYTPFSFLLFYEVLVLVRVLPESFSRSVKIQFEVVALIVLRRVFKDVAHLDGVDVLELTNPVVWELVADMVGAVVLFVLTRQLRGSKPAKAKPKPLRSGVANFISLKKGLSLLLGVLVFVLAAASLIEWSIEMFDLAIGERATLSDVNALFYEDFFGLLVLVDVLLLVVSFGIDEDTSMIFRNAGFVASTVLVRLSFTAPRLHSIVLLVFAVGFCLTVQVVVERRWLRGRLSRGGATREGETGEAESRAERD